MFGTWKKWAAVNWRTHRKTKMDWSEYRHINESIQWNIVERLPYLEIWEWKSESHHSKCQLTTECCRNSIIILSETKYTYKYSKDPFRKVCDLLTYAYVSDRFIRNGSQFYWEYFQSSFLFYIQSVIFLRESDWYFPISWESYAS